MYEKQMEVRCKDSVFVAVGLVEDYILNFRKSCSNFYATLDKKENTKTPVVIWSISENDEKSLDCYEGVHKNCYYKTEVEAITDTGVLTGLCYLLDENREIGLPNEAYIDILTRSYHRFKFDDSRLKQLVSDLKE